MDTIILPLLLCPEDLDFTCIVIVVEGEKTKNYLKIFIVLYGKSGYVKTGKKSYIENV